MGMFDDDALDSGVRAAATAESARLVTEQEQRSAKADEFDERVGLILREVRDALVRRSTPTSATRTDGLAGWPVPHYPGPSWFLSDNAELFHLISGGDDYRRWMSGADIAFRVGNQITEAGHGWDLTWDVARIWWSVPDEEPEYRFFPSDMQSRVIGLLSNLEDRTVALSRK